ncbi:angiotensin-converting enzyme-like [Diorhabda carinulata]|uniref:angiotensin-converting enzyme-like n=1 Tax=Diorhabda carinulata TaxID=1163345 RepID=UPI0025A10890|nr:angiotensin-converting enzyme-like [Diorhabda carinulata]
MKIPKISKGFFFVIFFSVCATEDAPFLLGKNSNIPEAVDFLRDYDLEGSEVCFRVNMAQWHYSTNMTDFLKRKMIEEQTLKAKFDKLVYKRASIFDWMHIEDLTIKRQLKMLTTNTRASLPFDKYNEIYYLISEMKDVYSNIKVCPYQSDDYGKDISYCDLDMEDVHAIMARSRNPSELTHIWKEVHDKTGPQMKNKFMRYLELSNQASRLNGFTDSGAEMRNLYEDSNFENELTESMHKILPLYKELLTFVRRKLLSRYGDHVIRPEGPLPAHILGNLWAQDWTNIADIVLPYRDYSDLDITDEILRQGFTPLRMFHMAEEFFTSMGLKPMPPEFWRYSMIEKPNGRKVQCTASAWDFCNNVDFRIKQCTEVDMKNFVTIHHEMAHVQYYLYYAHQPFLYRDGSNPGFHEGVANAVILSIFNPKHLKRIGFFHNNTDNIETNINFLMLMALKKIAYAPFAYLIDQWRYQVAEFGVKRMNADWWDLRLRYQGIIPPITRSEMHFDAATKRHVPADIPYTKYFVALLLEFQIFESMCRAGRHIGPLHTCDIYRSREAGKVLMDVMRVGKSKHWREVVKMMTRDQTDKITADSMLNYFEPLAIWLREQNRNERIVGWTTYKEDTALYQPLVYYGSSNKYSYELTITNVILIIIFSKLL